MVRLYDYEEDEIVEDFEYYVDDLEPNYSPAWGLYVDEDGYEEWMTA